MPGKLNNIQALRAYAAVSVAYFHTGYVAPRLATFGFYGVDVFFVISGFIMAGICDSRPEKFFRRRLIRIVPMYWICTLGVFFLAMMAPGLLKATRPHVGELIKSLLFIPFFKGNGLPEPLLFVGWSLNYEMYFYVLLALALLIVAGRRAPLLASAVVIVVPLVLYPFAQDNAITLFYSRTRSYEFVLGVLTYFAAKKISMATARKLRVLMPILCALVVADLTVWFTLPLGRHFPPDWIGFGVPSVVLVLSAALMAKSGSDVRVKWIILLGDASYAIYLLHPYVLYFQERVLAKRWHFLSAEHTVPGMVLGVVAVCVVSCLVYLYIEKPLVDWLAKKYAPTSRHTRMLLAEKPL